MRNRIKHLVIPVCVVIISLNAFLTGCSVNAPEESDETNTESMLQSNEISEKITSKETTATHKEEAKQPDEKMESLQLLGGKVNENGIITINDLYSGDYEYNYDYDEIRKHFFGTWSYYPDGGLLVVDDSEKSNAHPILSPGVGVGGSVVFKTFINGGLGAVYWIDLNEPDTMYYISELYAGENSRTVVDKYSLNNIYTVFTKTDLPINEPENGFISRLKLFEKAEEYNVDFNLLSCVNYVSEYGQTFSVDDYYFSNRIYLVSESSDKLVLKTSLLSWRNFDTVVDTVYAVEKVNGVWEQSITEISEEQLKIASAEYIEQMKDYLSSAVWKYTKNSSLTFIETEEIDGRFCLVYQSDADGTYYFAIDENGTNKYVKTEDKDWVIATE